MGRFLSDLGHSIGAALFVRQARSDCIMSTEDLPGRVAQWDALAVRFLGQALG